MSSLRIPLLAVAALAFAAPLAAQQPAVDDESKFQPPTVVQYLRPYDKRGINIFETPKVENVPYTGFALQWGAAFTQQFQGLDHETSGSTALKPIGNGFNNATANLYMNAQVAPGIRVQLTTYLSSRHHPETYVKDGFLQVDASPLDVPLFHKLMEFTTLKIGHFQVNYGDFQFRRTDNGNAMYNPLVGNALMDAFTTEVGVEAIVQRNGLFGVIAATGGEIKGRVDLPDDRAPAYMVKAGFDRQLNDDLRVRLSGSYRTTASSISNSIYSGDRAGSRYYYVLENTAATESAQFTSGRINPGFSDEQTGYMINPFVKFRGAEFFGMYEVAKGRSAAETDLREVTQLMAEGLYRFGRNESLYLVGRWNNVAGDVGAAAPDADVTRTNFGGGWFVTPSLLMKAEWVNQQYKGYTGAADTRNGGKFSGFMIEAVLAF
ncbi:MAG: hypothetical protein KF689_01890 [Gemmatimonadaceae bacterium]|nr:hypothetical protein [Gemmatimonadaceae bacterium]MCW5826682.1 hypothetical protein [Gemmatimonadaceae bacterium]